MTTRLPNSLRLEASSVCQLRCPSCPTTTGEVHKLLGKGLLRVADVTRLLDANPQLKSLELSNYGEAFLNPHLLQIFHVAAERGVALTIKNGANLNNLREDVLEGLVKYGIRDITCSIDGASEATYGVYRRRGKFATVIANIRKINVYKAQYRSIFPRLKWQFIVFGHNEHEIAAARALAHELGMSFYSKISWDSEFSPVRDVERVKREAGLAGTTRSEQDAASGEVYLGKLCEQLWSEPQVNYDGRMLGCCVNFWGEFGGNAFDDFGAAFNSDRLSYARGMLTGRLAPRADIPCSSCDVYERRRAKNEWVRERPLRDFVKRMGQGIRGRIDMLRFSASRAFRHRPEPLAKKAAPVRTS